MINPREIKSENEYKDFVEKSAFLVDSELKKVEKIKEEGDHHVVALSLPKLISIINFAGYLRGQDGMFLDFRPYPLVDYQQELYKMENEFEKRLFALINWVKTTESKDLAVFRLNEYFLKHRGFG